MLNKKNLYIVIITAVITAVFIFSYNWGVQKFYSTKVKENSQLDLADKYASVPKNDTVISSNAKVLLKLKVKDSSNEYLVRTMNTDDLFKDKTDKLKISDLENYFKNENYIFSSYSNNEIVFIKESKFQPDKYYLGATEEGFLAIYKCNAEGNLFIEDKLGDVSEKKLKSLPSADQEFISNFEYKFESRDEAADELAAICS